MAFSKSMSNDDLYDSDSHVSDEVEFRRPSERNDSLKVDRGFTDGK